MKQQDLKKNDLNHFVTLVSAFLGLSNKFLGKVLTRLLFIVLFILFYSTQVLFIFVHPKNTCFRYHKHFLANLKKKVSDYLQIL